VLARQQNEPEKRRAVRIQLDFQPVPVGPGRAPHPPRAGLVGFVVTGGGQLDNGAKRTVGLLAVQHLIAGLGRFGRQRLPAQHNAAPGIAGRIKCFK